MKNMCFVLPFVSLVVLLAIPNDARAQEEIPIPEGFRIDCVRMYQGEGVAAPPPRFGIDRGQHWTYWALNFCDGFFRPNYAVVTCDLDSSGMIDSWELAIVGAVLCNPSHPLYASVDAAFQAHVAALASDVVAPYADTAHDFLAAHMLCSTSARDFWVTTLGLTGTYAPFTVGPDEVLSPSGDLDGDGYTNQEEYDNVRDAGYFGWRSLFYEAVADSGSDGTIAVPSGGVVARNVLVTACVIVGVCAIAGAFAIRRRQRDLSEEA